MDAKVVHDKGVYNPYDGNLLETVISYESSKPALLHLAFPMGELGRDLSTHPLYSPSRVICLTSSPIDVSPFLPSENGKVFTPAATPAKSFDTPISQITSPRYDPQNPAQSRTSVVLYCYYTDHVRCFLGCEDLWQHMCLENGAQRYTEENKAS